MSRGRATLLATLERLCAETDTATRLAADPVRVPHLYADPADREVAAVLAASLAYGRVAAFRPVLDRLVELADAAGGPRAWVDAFEPEVHGPPLRPLYYRWNRGVDWILLLSALNRLYREAPSLEHHLRGDTLPDALDALIGAIRGAAVAAAPGCGVRAATFDALPRGFRTLVPRPADGSATKRWWMFLRWMIRPADGVDLGLWTRWHPRTLVIPLDTHVLRISRFVGLTRRTDGSLRTAIEVTDALRQLDPDDPVRFDFALAHLGISGACRGHRDPSVCPGCPLDPVCTAG
ncbi:MAG: TIGR02757 family protein [Myxococcota bacterium]